MLTIIDFGQNFRTIQSCPILAVILLLVVQFSADLSVNGVRCFCDRRKCDDSICQSNWCQIGFDDANLIQSCATDEDGLAAKSCKRHWNGWDEVCSCQTEYCNTFEFLRQMIREHEPMGDAEREELKKSLATAGVAVSAADSDDVMSGGRAEGDPLRKHRKNRITVIGEVDSIPPGSYNDEYYGNSRSKDPSGSSDFIGIFDPNQLIALVVLVPLCIGACAVCIVFFNYQCRMC